MLGHAAVGRPTHTRVEGQLQAAARLTAWSSGGRIRFWAEEGGASMTPLLMATALLFGAEAKTEDAPKVEGRWRIVYAEEGGRRNNAWEQRAATVRDNAITYEAEGKMRSLKLSFEPHQAVKAIGEGETKGEYSGVYILSQDYLCLSLNAKEGDKGRGESSGSFILILRKQRDKN
jgi:hypothetical protein